MADGAITFSTALDNEQLERDIRSTIKEIDDLRRKTEEGKAEESFLKAKMERAREATEEARKAVEDLRAELGVADEGALAQSLRDANREVSSLERSLSATEGKRSAVEEQMDAAEPAIRRTEQRLRNLKALLEELEGVDPLDADAWHGAQREIGGTREAIAETSAELERQVAEQDALGDRWQDLDARVGDFAARLQEATARQQELAAKSSRLSEANAALKEQTKEQDRLTRKWQATSEQVDRYNRQLERAQSRQKALGEEYARTYSAAGQAISSGMARAGSAVDAFGRKVNVERQIVGTAELHAPNLTALVAAA